MSLLALSGTNSVSGGYEIDNSLKFERANGEQIFTSNAAAGNRRTWTFSAWIKRTQLSQDYSTVFSCGYSNIQFMGNDRPRLILYNGSSEVYADPEMLMRDTSAWYHIVVQVDSTQSTASDRVKWWINGDRITDFNNSTYTNMSQNEEFDFGQAGSGSGNWLRLGEFFGGSEGFGGYMADVYYLNGTAAQASDFGEYDSDSGIWIPKAYTGSGYGTQGFHYKFDNASNLGEDSSGEGHDANNLNNITSADQATDTPTNNFCTLNFNTGYIQGSDATTFTQGATTRQGGTSSYNGALGTIGINPFVGSAKWYWEVELSADNNGNGIELAAGWLATSIAQSNTANKAVAGNSAGFQIWTSFDWSPPTEGIGADGDIFGFLLQCDSSSPNLKIYKNDTLFTTRTHLLPYDFENDFYFPVVFIYNTNLKAFCNFGNPFDATVSSGNTDPNGYGNFEFDTKGGYALCSRNLSEFG
jgi:hypothetical protein